MISYFKQPEYVLKPGVGYAIRAYRDCNIEVRGRPWNMKKLDLKPRTNYLIGAPYKRTSVREILGTCSLDKLNVIYFDYSSGAEKRVNVTMLEPGKAYWVQSVRECTFGMPPCPTPTPTPTPSPSPTPCIPKTCEELGWECGSGIEPDCNTEIDCGECGEGYICRAHVCVQNVCRDGTPYGACSTSKPYYCEEGNLIPKCSLCGCDANYVCDFNTEQCIPSGISSFTLHLINNWNYISVPLKNANLTLRTLYEKCGAYYVYYWDPRAERYKVKLYSNDPDYSLAPGVGYIVKPNKECSIELSGIPWNFEPLTLEVGKSYLVGAPFEETYLEKIKGNCSLDALTVTHIDYSSGSEERREVRVLEPGKAYWVQSSHNCVLRS